MKACAAFDDLLVDYDELSPEERLDVDEHLRGCSSCREYLAMLGEIDRTLTALVVSVHLDPERVTDVRQFTGAEPVGRVSRLPEWLDFVAAAAVLAFAGGLAWQAGLFVVALNALGVSP